MIFFKNKKFVWVALFIGINVQASANNNKNHHYEKSVVIRAQFMNEIQSLKNILTLFIVGQDLEHRNICAFDQAQDLLVGLRKQKNNLEQQVCEITVISSQLHKYLTQYKEKKYRCIELIDSEPFRNLHEHCCKVAQKSMLKS